MADSTLSNMAGPISGTGVGLRHCHIQDVLFNNPDIPWFEILTDNHLEPGGPVKHALQTIRQDYVFSFHCVGMSLGGVDPLEINYLKQIKQLGEELDPIFVSDHLSFSTLNGQHYNELLPLPYTEDSLKHICDRILQVQDILNRQILIENPSSYLSYQHSTLDEWDFMNELAKQADCHVLLDVNNIYVSACNHGFDSNKYLSNIDFSRVKEIHLGGYEDRGHYLLDAHNHPISDEVWELFKTTIGQAPEIPCLIEWDNDIPALEVLQQQASIAEDIRQNTMQEALLESA
ncbi:MAG: DUF692 domain-containing protein [Gammaproteobacteria bacterium]|nr:DUF692 domain-containing protein [Gammaproteobacteria bacterium]